MIWRLAYRNLWRNKRRTILTLAAMALSAALLILLLAISEGMMADLLTTTTRQYTGDAVVAAAEYRRDQDFFAVLDDPAHLVGLLKRDPAVEGASPRLRAFGLLSHGDQTVAGEVLGVDWDREPTVTTLHRNIREGRYPTSGEGPGMVVGEGLAKKLGVGLGGEVILVSQAADGSIGNELFSVTGIFRTGDFGRDNYLALAGRERLGRTLALEGKAHEIAVALHKPAEAPLVVARLEQPMRDAQADAQVASWQQLLPILAQMMDIFQGSMIITTVILYFAAGMVVVNTLLMAFHERTREFGVLMAIGMSPRRVRLIIVTEAFLLGLIAAGLGSVTGVGLSLALHRGVDVSAFMKPVAFGGGSILPVIRAVILPRDLYIPFLGMVLMSLGAVMPAVLEGGRRSPAEDLQTPIA